VQLSLKWRVGRISLPVVKHILCDLLQRACNIHTLYIDCDDLHEDSGELVTMISLTLSSKVKHIKVNAHNSSLMMSILDQSKHLSSLTFKSSQNFSNEYNRIIHRLKQNKRDFTYRKYKSDLGLWFGKHKIETDEIKL
jgi:hypothetical protein